MPADPDRHGTAIVGVLLAAGRGTRFGGQKLLARLQDGDHAGECLAVAALVNLAGAVAEVVAVVRDGETALADALAAKGARVVVCPNADDGMGASLACGVRAAAGAEGFVIALADMPSVRPATVARIAAAIAGGASMAAPYCHGRRGHPVGFAGWHEAALVALTGDVGAKALLGSRPEMLVRIDVDDPGVIHDVDTPADL